MEESLEKLEVVPRRNKTWKRNFDFVLSILGMMIGLGNIWRFPYLCYKNGGGVFLIPYLLLIVIFILPLVVIESAIGQYCGRSTVIAWKLVPLMRGIGLLSPVWLFYCNLYYPVILAWALRWLVASFSSPLPWITCGNDWNTEHCYPVTVFEFNRSKLVGENVSMQFNLTHGETDNKNFTGLARSSTEEYWKRNVLALTESLEEPGGIKWDLLACLAGIWVLTYFSIWKGIDWTSKIVYVTATLPLVMILIVVVRGLTLPGSGDGINFYLKPNMTKLLEIDIWMDAASQVIYSCCVAGGALTTMSQFNRFNHNFLRDSVILLTTNACASILSGFGIFSVLGYLAKIQNSTVADVAESGPGLIFVAYPTALTLLPLPNFWSAMFFVMIILLGLDGQFIYQESFVSCLKDLFPRLYCKLGREAVTAVCTILMLLAGMSMVTNGGMYVFNLFDNYAVAGWCMFFIGTCECITIGWLYGGDRLCDNIKEMLGYNIPRLWFKFCWKFAAPMTTFAIMIYSLVKYKPLVYDRTYVYPTWANVLGWMWGLSSMLWIPCTAVYELWKAEGATLKEKFKTAIKPDKEWEDINRRTEEMENIKLTIKD